MLAELAPAMQQLEDVKRRLQAAGLQHGETVTVGRVTVEVREGYERVTWDGRALAGYAAANPAINEFKSVTPVRPTAAVKVR
jgi:hypothetical protein